ncbi:MAG: TIGR02466 family protein [Steroidobacteraceae bacterium]
MPTRALFPTLVYETRLPRAPATDLHRRLLRECHQYAADDLAGQRWSRRNYPGGYTSYGSLCQMQRVSPTFAELERRIAPHLRAYVAALHLDMRGRELAMTDCWINIMPPLVVHSQHIHTLATISGTYYVRTPRGCAGIKFEDPRLDRFMAAPPRRADAPAAQCPWVSVAAEAGKLVLFESWLRHEVPPNPVRSERISVSFNYSWF